MSNEMNAEERAALVKRLRSRDAEDVLVRDFKATADLIEADGKRLRAASSELQGAYAGAAELRAQVRYYQALQRGLSEAEAQEDGWPSDAAKEAL